MANLSTFCVLNNLSYILIIEEMLLEIAKFAADVGLVKILLFLIDCQKY